MRKNTHKGILNFLQRIHPAAQKGQTFRRFRLMACLIQACISTRLFSLEKLSMPSEFYRTQKKESLLQQTKRWLANKWTDWESCYKPFVQYILRIIARKREIVLILDGTQIGSTNVTLMLSALLKDEAIPLVWTVRKGKKGHFPKEMHTQLLEMIYPLCPPSCRVVLLGDGEFDSKHLMTWCLQRGWSFVLRTCADRRVNFGGRKGRFDSLKTRRRVVFIPQALRWANGVYWLGKGYSRAIFLLTNMASAQEACRYYKRRFKIESMFKHLKSRGFHLHKTQLKCPWKLSNLIIVVAYAFVFSFCMGLFIKQKESPQELETLVRKSRLSTITPIVLAQEAVKRRREATLIFFSNLSKNFAKTFT